MDQLQFEAITDDEFKQACTELRATLASMSADIKSLATDMHNDIQSLSDEMHAGFREIKAMITELNTIPTPAPVEKPIKLPWYRRSFE